MSDTDPSGGNPVLIPRSAAKWVWPVISSTALGIAAWSHGILWGHESAITKNSADIQSLQQARSDDQGRLNRIESKVDIILERIR